MSDHLHDRSEKFLEQSVTNRGVSLTLDADGFGPDGLSRVHIVQFVAIDAIATSSREYFLHEAIRHELVTVLRCIPFARIALATHRSSGACHGVW